MRGELKAEGERKSLRIALDLLIQVPDLYAVESTAEASLRFRGTGEAPVPPHDPLSPMVPAGGNGSGAGYEEVFVGLGVYVFWGDVGGDVLHEFAAALGAFAFNYADAAGGHGAGLEADDAAIAHLNL